MLDALDVGDLISNILDGSVIVRVESDLYEGYVELDFEGLHRFFKPSTREI